MNAIRKLLRNAADWLELPADIVAGVPRVEVIGSEKCNVEPHGGLLEYGLCKITVATASGYVTVLGEGLTIHAMNRLRLTITGKITALQMENDWHE